MMNNALINYFSLFIIMNILEFIIGLIMFLLPDKKGWLEYLICFYGGFFLGVIPFYLLFNTVISVFVGCAIVSGFFIYINRNWDKKMIPFGIVILKLNMILGCTFFEEYYSSNRLNFFILAIFLTSIIFWGISFLYGSLPDRVRLFIVGLFGILELSGSIVQFYRIDYTIFDKDLFSKEESLSLILYLCKVDYWIFDYQYFFLSVIVLFLFIFIIWRNVLKKIVNIIVKRRGDRRKK